MGPLIAAMCLVGAVAFFVGAIGLHKRSRLGWYGQLFPGAIVALVLVMYVLSCFGI